MRSAATTRRAFVTLIGALLLCVLTSVPSKTSQAAGPQDRRPQRRDATRLPEYVNFFTNVKLAEAHAKNIGRSAPGRERWILMATLIDWPKYFPEKTAAACARLEQRGFRVTVGVAHPPIYEYDDWFKTETWQAVADAFETMKAHADDLVAYDVEPYRLKGRRYPRTRDVATDGWRLADAARPFINWLKRNRKKLLIEQAHEDHLFEHVLRLNGVAVIWADSELKPMPYSVNDRASIAKWERIAEKGHDRIRSFGCPRWPTLRARGLVEPQAMRIALENADGGVTVFFNDTAEREADPRAKWRYPTPGWADVLKRTQFNPPE